MAKAIATESEANFIAIKGPSLLSKWVGESERSLRDIFHKARMASPAIIFFDEIDAIASGRSGMGEDNGNVGQRILSQLLTEMDGLEPIQDIVIIAATNRPDLVDTALLRPGRFDRIIHISTPDENARKKILHIHTRTMPLAEDVFLDQLAQELVNYTGADIEALCREAGLLALREDIHAEKVYFRHFKMAMQSIYGSINEKVLQFYADIEKQFRNKIRTSTDSKEKYDFV